MLLRVPTDITPMEARLVEKLPREAGWQYEPKWDGFRCLVFRDGSEVELRGKSGKSLNRFFPDIVVMLASLPMRKFALDGELLIAVNGEFSFDALQMRLHPALSRVAKLAREQPATFIAFDCLLDAKARSLLDESFEKRRAALEELFARIGASEDDLALTPATRDAKEAGRWLTSRNAQIDGVIAKRLDLPYEPGERAMLKVKRLRTADCVVGGFRYESNSRLVGSLLLGLYDDEGLLHHVGFTSAISANEKPAITKKLEKLIAPPGFTGDAPGGPSRWSTERSAEWQPLKPKLVVEVRYDHVSGERFRHGTKLVRWRPDKSPRQCTFEQLDPAGKQKGVAAAGLRM
jgi:ATP-dependent DNA ligase